MYLDLIKIFLPTTVAFFIGPGCDAFFLQIQDVEEVFPEHQYKHFRLSENSQRGSGTPNSSRRRNNNLDGCSLHHAYFLSRFNNVSNSLYGENEFFEP